jgi:hypothetical protein
MPSLRTRTGGDRRVGQSSNVPAARWRDARGQPAQAKQVLMLTAFAVGAFVILAPVIGYYRRQSATQSR